MDADFPFVADHPALDFLNTLGVADGFPVDRLGSPGAVAAWLAGAGLLDEAAARSLRADAPRARLLLLEAHRLRDAVLEAVTAWTRGAQVSEAALEALDRVLASGVSRRRLERDGPGLRVVEVPERDGPRGLLAPVALAAAELLVAGDPARVRRCDADDCVLWFLDTSRNGSRRWCSMAVCGNRAKVAAHYRRTREPGEGGDAADA